jgi:hypothetical protein
MVNIYRRFITVIGEEGGIKAILDSGSEVNLLSERVHENYYD